MIAITYDYFENCIKLQIITITDNDYPRSAYQSSVSHEIKIAERVFQAAENDLGFRQESPVSCDADNICKRLLNETTYLAHLFAMHFSNN